MTGLMVLIIIFGIGLVCFVLGIFGEEIHPVLASFGGFALFLSLSVFFKVIPNLTFYSSTYYLPCELVAVNNNIKFFEDEDGNIWQWEDDKEYSMNTLYLLTMNDNDTRDDTTDDIIQVVWMLGGGEIDNSVG